MNTAHLRFPCFLGKRVHLGVTGSVAAYKSLELLRLLVASQISVGVTLTASAQRFVGAASFQALGADPVYTSMFDGADEASAFGHLAPGRTAHALVIAPASANVLAKVAHGIADDMLSTQALAFSGPMLLAPAMNPAMWAAKATQENWSSLLRRGAVPVGPDCGSVACGDTGAGRLAPVEAIFAEVLRALSPQDLAGRKVLVTLGPTREHWDAVRFLSNPSSGLMGACLAVAAWMRGAQVHVVAGPTAFEFPQGIAVTRVTSAQEMLDAAIAVWPGCDIGCCTAAVCDFCPVPPEGGVGRKFKKREAAELPVIALRRNPDILRTLGACKTSSQLLIGFAAETSDLLTQARLKLAEKRLDLIVANPVAGPGQNSVSAPPNAFESSSNTVLVVDRTGRVEQWPELPKPEVAWRIWDHLQHL